MIDPIADLTQLAESFFEAESVSRLIARIEEFLEESQAVPARLYLVDHSQGVFYQIAGIRSESTREELTPEVLERPGSFPLYSRREMVGLLTVHAEEFDHQRIKHAAGLIGPALMAMEMREQLLEQVRELRSQNERLVAAGSLLRHLDLEQLLVELLETLLAAVTAQVGAILLADSSGKLELRSSFGLDEQHLESLRFEDGRRLVDAAFTRDEPLLLRAAECEREIVQTGVKVALTGILALPLISSSGHLGLVLLANPEGDFGPAQSRLAGTVCGMATIALDNVRMVQSMVEGERMRRDLDIARDIQTSMFPAQALVTGNITVAGRSRPSEETGGDYFGYQSHNGRLVAVVGDVTGHGIGAALFTTVAHAMFQQQVREGIELGAGLSQLSGGLHALSKQRFMTMGVVEIDLATLALTYASAGHNPLLWLSGTEVRWLESLAVPLGMLATCKQPVAQAGTLQTGDWLLLYTDGLTEATNADEELYGEDRMANFVAKARSDGLDAEKTLDALVADVDRWHCGKILDDDLTVVLLTVTRGD